MRKDSEEKKCEKKEERQGKEQCVLNMNLSIFGDCAFIKKVIMPREHMGLKHFSEKCMVSAWL